MYTLLRILTLCLTGLAATGSYAQVTVKPLVTHASCNGGSDGKIQLQVTGTPPFSYKWSNQAITPEISELNAGSYHVRVTDARGNRGEAQVQVQNRSALTVEKKQVVVPQPGTRNGLVAVQVTGGHAPYSFFLSNYTDLNAIDRQKQSEGTFKGLARGRYLVDVVDARGCSASLSISLK